MTISIILREAAEDIYEAIGMTHNGNLRPHVTVYEPSYMTHEQLVAIRDGWLEMKERIEELESKLHEQDSE